MLSRNQKKNSLPIASRCTSSDETMKRQNRYSGDLSWHKWHASYDSTAAEKQEEKPKNTNYLLITDQYKERERERSENMSTKTASAILAKNIIYNRPKVCDNLDLLFEFETDPDLNLNLNRRILEQQWWIFILLLWSSRTN